MNCKLTHRYTDWLTNRQTYEQKKKKSKKLTLSVVSTGPLDKEYLYYPLDVEGVPLKDSLLPAHIRYSKQ